MPTFDTTFFARVDSSSAGNDAINLDNQESDVFTITFNGDPTLELDGGVAGTEDPNTTVQIDGIIDGVVVSGEYTFTLFVVGTLPTSGGGLQKLPSDGAGGRLFTGEVAYVIQITDPTAPDNSGNTLQLMFLPGVDATESQMAGFAGSGALPLSNSNYSPPPQPICFASGTLVLTTAGEKSVDDLAVGDRCVTADGHERSVVWVSSSLHAWPEGSEKDKPVLFSAGALGGGLPKRDLAVSPQHHMLLSNDTVKAMFGIQEVLAPAKALTDMPGVRMMHGKRSVEYFHVMFERHEIVIAEGAPAESFYPGPMALRMMSAGQRASLLAVVPTLRDDPENGYGPTARKKITRRQAEQLVEAMKNEAKEKEAFAG